jgi:hypothetical protein
MTTIGYEAGSTLGPIVGNGGQFLASNSSLVRRSASYHSASTVNLANISRRDQPGASSFPAVWPGPRWYGSGYAGWIERRTTIHLLESDSLCTAAAAKFGAEAGSR